MAWDLLILLLVSPLQIFYVLVNISLLLVFGSSSASRDFGIRDTFQVFNFWLERIALSAHRLKALPCFIQIVFDVGDRIWQSQKFMGFQEHSVCAGRNGTSANTTAVLS